MSFEQQKKRLLGWLALVAPLPLPFNEVLEWPYLIAFLLVVVFFLHRVDRGAPTLLPVWALNVLALVYFPIFGFEVLRAVQTDFNSFIKALLHLILFLLAVKLFSIRREGDKWHVVLAVFFVFIGAMATSSHLAVAPYLLVFGGLAFYLLARFAQLHSLGRQNLQASGPPMRGPLAVGGLAVLVLAVPLFPLMPRLREPLVMGAGGAVGSMMRSTGFSDSVNLSLTSSVRQNRSVALRIEYQQSSPPAEEIRLKGATYDFYRSNQWYRSRHRENLFNFPDRNIELIPASSQPASQQMADIFLEPIGARSLLVPVEAIRVDLGQLRTVERDAGGALILPVPMVETLAYQVELAAEPVLTGLYAAADEQLNALDRSGLTPRIEDLAAQVMGATEDPPLVRARRLENHLQTGYAYTLDFLGRDGQNPLEDFLFEHKSGHCEYFASSMVLMLRSQGIPARLVTGFLGGEYNPVEGYFLVRQASAHAWVEALVDGRWRIYDPTPFDGRPLIAEQSLTLLAGQLYDALIYRWDRYVLTFGADDQLGFFQRARQGLSNWWQRLTADEDEVPSADDPAANNLQTGDAADALMASWQWPLVGLLVLLVAALALAYWGRMPPRSAAAAYESLRQRLRRFGLDVPDSLAPLAVQQLIAANRADAALPARRVVGLYLREAYAGEDLGLQDRMTLRDALRSIAMAFARRPAQRSSQAEES